MTAAQIYVCSRGRARRDVQYTIGFLIQAGVAANVVVPAAEADDYRRVYSQMTDDPTLVTVIARPETVTNLAQSIEHIIYDLAIDHNAIIMDDDLKFSRRAHLPFSESRTELIPCGPKDLMNLMGRLSDLLTVGPMAGVSARGGNNNRKKALEPCSRQMQVHAIDTAWFRANDIRPSKVICKSDFFMTLSVLTRGEENNVLCEYAVDQAKASNAAGGVSIYRDMEMMNAAAHRLKELFPNYVKIVEKRVTWKGLDTGALDVQIQWKKAYKEAQK